MSFTELTRLSDRTLQRWLRTGRPARVERNLHSADVTGRLEAMTQLEAHHIEALHVATSPAPGYQDRVIAGIGRRTDHDTVETLVDLLTLGWHTTATIVDPFGSVAKPSPDNGAPNEH